MKHAVVPVLFLFVLISGQRLEAATQPVASVRPGFDPKDVVRQIRTPRSAVQPLGPSTPGFDDGEFLIDTSNALVPTPFDQGSPALAFDGENFLVVWQDDRGHQYECDIYGARVTPTGLVLDTAGIAISTAVGNQEAPVIAFDGENFLVVWTDNRSDMYGDIYGARVTPAGVVLDQQGIAVSTAASQQHSPALAFDGEDFLAVWQDTRDGSWNIYGARVTPAGLVLDTADIAISTAASGQYHPAIAFDGENFLAVWHDERSSHYSDIYGARVTPAGEILDTGGIAISTATSFQQCPSLACDGENFLVVWQDARNGSDWDIYGARVTPAGVVLDPAGIAISTAAANYKWYPAVAVDGENFMVVWQDDRNSGYDIYGARVTPAGVVLDTAGITISTATGGQESPALAFDGENLVVAWTDGRNGSNADIYGARVTPAGAVIDTAGIAFSTVVGSQESPALAFDGENYLVVWQNDRSGSSDVYGTRVTPAGVVLDTVGIAIATSSGNQGSPALAFDGVNFLVVWQDESSDSNDVYGARVTPAGVVLDTAGIAISTAAEGYQQVSPALAFDGENFLVTWTVLDYRIPLDIDIYGARVTPAGVVLDTAGIAISTATGYQESAALAFDGTNFLVTWQDQRSGSDDIYGARVTRTGLVLDTAGIAISTGANSQLCPTLAFDGANFLVTWQDQRNGSGDIYGARVTRTGLVLDTAGIAVSTATDDQNHPALAFDGANFLVVWEDGRSGDSTDIYGVRVTPAGVVFDSGPVVRQEGGQYHPVLAHGTGNQMFLVYQGWAGTVGDKTYNTQRVWGKMSPNPAITEMTRPEVRKTNGGATIVRGVLTLGAIASRQTTGYRVELLDISGRKVLDLHPGANDVRALAPGVYFVREASGVAREASRVTKVIVTR